MTKYFSLIQKFIESYAQALLRAKQYERRLGQAAGKSKRNKKKTHQSNSSEYEIYLQ